MFKNKYLPVLTNNVTRIPAIIEPSTATIKNSGGNSTKKTFLINKKFHSVAFSPGGMVVGFANESAIKYNI